MYTTKNTTNLSSKLEAANHALVKKNENFSVGRHLVFKADGIREGIIFQSDDYNMTPVLYPNGDLMDMDDDSFAEYLTDFFHLHARSLPAGIYAEHENILSEILPRLCSGRLIPDLQETGVAHIPFLDLAICFYLPFDDGCIQVSNVMLSNAQVTLEEALDAARQNMDDACEVKSLSSMLFETMDIDCEMDDGPQDMIVITNKSRVDGAAGILCDRVLHEVSNILGKKSDFWILPSSRHEVICVPCSSGDPSELAKIVSSINEAEVSTSDFLSNSVYGFINGTLTVVAK